MWALDLVGSLVDGQGMPEVKTSPAAIWARIEPQVARFVSSPAPLSRLLSPSGAAPMGGLHRRQGAVFLHHEEGRFVGWLVRHGLEEHGDSPWLSIEEERHGVVVHLHDDVTDAQGGPRLVLTGATARDVSRALSRLHTTLAVSPASVWEENALLTRAVLDVFLAVAEAVRWLMEMENDRMARTGVVAAALHYIDEHFTHPLQLGEVAEAIGCNPRLLARQIQVRSATRFTEHLMLARLLQARRLLAHGSQSIPDVAHAVGGMNRDSLTRAFRRLFGVTPLTFRKNFREAATGCREWHSLFQVADTEPGQWLEATGASGHTTWGGECALFFLGNASPAPRVVRSFEESTIEHPQVLLPGDLVVLRRVSTGGLVGVFDAEGRALGHLRPGVRRAMAVIRS